MVETARGEVRGARVEQLRVGVGVVDQARSGALVPLPALGLVELAREHLAQAVVGEGVIAAVDGLQQARAAPVASACSTSETASSRTSARSWSRKRVPSNAATSSTLRVAAGSSATRVPRYASAPDGSATRSTLGSSSCHAFDR